MRGDENKQSAMYSYVTMTQRIPADHPARSIRAMVDRALERMDAELEQLYSHTGRPSIAPERLLRASLLMLLYSIRSERQLMEQLNYNLLFPLVCGFGDGRSGVGRDGVYQEPGASDRRRGQQAVAVGGAGRGEEHELLSEEHFTVDGTLIQAWASARSFQEKSDPPAPGAGTGHKGEVLLRDKVESNDRPGRAAI